VKFLPQPVLRAIAVAVCAFASISLVGCKHSGGRVLEVEYVSGVQVILRDRVAAVFEKTGTVKNGDRVEVLDHDRHFAKVRMATGETGWMEQRYLVSQQVFDQLQKLTADNANDSVQAQGITRNDTNLHVEPGRETEHLYQILSGEKLALLKRGTAEKAGSVAPPSRTATAADKAAEKKTPEPIVEDWWLVRDSHGRVGWVLARMVDIDVPIDVAQYAEGQRIVAFFVLNRVQDGDTKVPQYLMVLTEPKDGLPFDFNQFRVFTWNVKRHRYETAYRERIEGILPAIVKQEDFGKEGVLPAFVIRVLDGDGKVSERKYKLNTPMVRRVLAPGEEPVHATHAAAKGTGRRHKR
jgi:SH3-like domain-containing protein